ncbi:MAG: hypothetical protein RL307_572 [Pseudomonadota bacterium]|jgi:transcriptional regulator PpsR
MKFAPQTPEFLSRLIARTSDIALVVDAQGVVVDVSLGKTELTVLGCQDWLGRPLTQSLTTESLPKFQALLADARNSAEPIWRHLNHVVPGSDDVAIQYTAMALDDKGHVFLFGRDLEAIAVVQRQLVETQQAMERDYVRLRHLESRYRLLLDTSREPVLVVDANSYKVIDASLSAQALYKEPNRRLIGRDVFECFEGDGRQELRAALSMSLATGRMEMCRSRLLGASQDCTVSASVFRQDGGAQYLLRMHAQDGRAEAVPMGDEGLNTSLVKHAPIGIVLTDRQGRIQSANEEFLVLVGAMSVSQLKGQSMDAWLQRSGVDWGVLNTHLRQQQSVRGFATELNALSGLTLAVDISAVAVGPIQGETLYALFIRDTERLRQSSTPSSSVGMAGSVAELASLVGRMPMKDIVGETIDMIERQCIQSALELTQNNRASAAEMLGVSRQSLYVKLRRFGMASDEEITVQN